MIEYIIPENIDDRVLKKASNVLAGGGLVAHPTDTTWHISCSASNAAGTAKLIQLKPGSRSRMLTLFALNMAQISELAEISTAQYKTIHRLSPGPYVFILEATMKTSKITAMKRREIGLRICADPVSRTLIEAAGTPLFSTTAGRNMEEARWWDPEFAEENLFEMGWELEDISGLDMILDGGDSLSKQLTTVLDLSTGETEIIREGLGPLP